MLTEDPPSPLWRIRAPYFIAGVVWLGGRVERTAPIVKFMRGWEGWRVREYCARKGWQVKEV